MAAGPAEIPKRPYITKVVIRGFKTYGGQTEIEPFDKGMNVIVGKNGSGKSNFTEAICFVLSSDKYFKMGSETRKRLLHRGSGETVLSGYVELHFDNSQGLFPMGMPSEVVIRRVVGLKKDEFFLNNKRSDREDIMNIFETIGFSRSNPYNMVLQGQVDALTAMSDADRLELFKDIAGARLYDEKRKESSKLLSESDEKCAKIDSVIASLSERIEALGSEKDEFTAYQDLDRKRRALEFRLQEIELQDAEVRIGKLDTSRTNAITSTSEIHTQKDTLESEIEEIEQELKASTAQFDRLASEKESLDNELAEVLSAITRVSLEHSDAEGIVQETTTRKQQLEENRDRTQAQIAAKERELQQLKVHLEEAVSAESHAKDALSDADRRVKELQAKQGRKNQFKDKKSRDKWIDKEMDHLKQSKQSKEIQLNNMKKEIERLNLTIEESKRSINERDQKKKSMKSAVDSINSALTAAKDKRNELADNMRKVMRQKNALEEDIVKEKTELSQLQRAIEANSSREVAAGLDSVKKMQEEGNKEIRGTLLELISVPQSVYHTAIEVIMGPTLNYVVVGTDKAAATVLNNLVQHDAGRITVIPLNKINPKPDIDFELPPNCIRAMEVVEYQMDLAPVVSSILGRTLICMDFEDASRYAHQYKVACVTLSGDKVSPKGAVTGGYLDVKAGKIRARHAYVEANRKIEDLHSKHHELSSKTQNLETLITQAVSDVEKFERNRTQEILQFDTFLAASLNASRELIGLNDSLSRHTRGIAELERSIAETQASIDALLHEQATDMIQTLSATEDAELAQLEGQLDTLNQNRTTALTTRASVEAQKIAVENELSNILHPTFADISTRLANIEISGGTNQFNGSNLPRLARELDHLRAQSEELQMKQRTTNEAIQQASSAVSELTASLSSKKTELTTLSDMIFAKSHQVEKILNERSIAIQKKEEQLRKIREIGSLSSKALEEVATINKSTCLQQLSETKNDLTKYSQINRKALEQWESFTREQEQLTERRKQMQSDEAAIHELLQSLDTQKEEAIFRTFKQIAASFEEIFLQLCPEGSGTLKKLTRPGRHGEPDALVGIELSVKFGGTAHSREGAAIRQLSGGQRTIVALALIFAIQKCDPAPFYIFDEIDPALDDKYRSTVARIIKQQSETTQFIIVTHRPEMIRLAHKVYMVTYQNKISEIESVDPDVALDVVAQAAKEEKGQRREEGEDDGELGIEKSVDEEDKEEDHEAEDDENEEKDDVEPSQEGDFTVSLPEPTQRVRRKRGL